MSFLFYKNKNNSQLLKNTLKKMAIFFSKKKIEKGKKGENFIPRSNKIWNRDIFFI
jgi:hypothetical protein